MAEINFHNIDCMQFMANVPDKYYDIAIVDPPYGIDVAASGKVGGNNCGKAKDYGAKEWDKQPPNEEYFSQLRRVSKNQIVWGANHFISRLPFDSSCWLVWDKDNSGNFADCELAWTSFDTAVRKFKWTWNGFRKQEPEERIHPTQKPIALYRWILQNYAKKGDKIIDTHGGSMSSAIACDMEGFDLDICEIDKDYFDAGIKRFNNYKLQLKLF